MFLNVKNLNLVLNNQTILRNISFNVDKGETLSIIGPSGCGKSSILKIIVGIHKQYKGAVILEDKTLTNIPINERDITLVFQDYSLFPHMTTYENMLVGSEDKEKNDFILNQMGIFELKEKYPHEMSGGEQQRVAIARAIAHCPKLLLLDEPFSNIDAITTKSLRIKVHELIELYGITTIMVTHDLDDVFEMSNRCVVMEKSKITQFNSLKNIYMKPKNRFVESLFCNLIEFGGEQYRAENIEILKNKSLESHQFKIINVKFKLHHNELVIESEDGIQLTIIDPNRSPLSESDIIHLKFNKEKVQ